MILRPRRSRSCRRLPRSVGAAADSLVPGSRLAEQRGQLGDALGRAVEDRSELGPRGVGEPNTRRSAKVSSARVTAAVVTNSVRDCPVTAAASRIRASWSGVRRIARRASLRRVASGVTVTRPLYAYCANMATVWGTSLNGRRWSTTNVLRTVAATSIERTKGRTAPTSPPRFRGERRLLDRRRAHRRRCPKPPVPDLYP